MKKLGLAVLLSLVFVSLTGCGGRSIHPIQTSFSEFSSTSKVEQAIVAAADELGWGTKKINQNTIEASLTGNGKYELFINIVYSNDNYVIHYKDSVNLRYKAGNNTIHKRYYRWVNRLDARIQEKLKVE